MRVWTRMTKLSSKSKFLSPRLTAKDVPNYNPHRIKILPPEYKKFHSEWTQESSPVHWIPSKENWERNPRTGVTTIIRDRPIPVVYPDQVHFGIWGGEGVVEGLVKKAKYRSPVPKFWVPLLQRSVVYSEILDKYLSVIVTQRALRLIDEHNGFDNYLLKNPANELGSLLALKIKKKILLALLNRDFAHNDPKKQAELLQKYKDYIIPANELEWYGLSIEEALEKYQTELSQTKVNAIQPLKFTYRLEFIQKLIDETIKASQEKSEQEQAPKESWLKKMNPFSKPDGATQT